MITVPYTIVDVFTEQKFAGNQLLVCKPESDIPTSTMLDIAREIHFSETTFIVSHKKSNKGYDVRIFTPREEIPFAGHPTLGTAAVIQKELESSYQPTIHLNLSVGQIPVTFSQSGTPVVWMKQNKPYFGQTLTPESITKVTNLPLEAIDIRFPIQEVSTGLPTIILPLTRLDAVQSIQVFPDRFLELIENLHAKTLFVFCPETENGNNGFHVRCFAHYYDIPEDPATGSANGCFAGYLVQHEIMGNDSIDTTVEQGIEMGRPSKLHLKAAQTAEGIKIHVGGQVQFIANGIFTI